MVHLVRTAQRNACFICQDSIIEQGFRNRGIYLRLTHRQIFITVGPNGLKFGMGILCTTCIPIKKCNIELVTKNRQECSLEPTSKV